MCFCHVNYVRVYIYTGPSVAILVHRPFQLQDLFAIDNSAIDAPSRRLSDLGSRSDLGTERRPSSPTRAAAFARAGSRKTHPHIEEGALCSSIPSRATAGVLLLLPLLALGCAALRCLL